MPQHSSQFQVLAVPPSPPPPRRSVPPASCRQPHSRGDVDPPSVVPLLFSPDQDYIFNFPTPPPRAHPTLTPPTHTRGKPRGNTTPAPRPLSIWASKGSLHSPHSDSLLPPTMPPSAPAPLPPVPHPLLPFPVPCWHCSAVQEDLHYASSSPVYCLWRSSPHCAPGWLDAPG